MYLPASLDSLPISKKQDGSRGMTKLFTNFKPSKTNVEDQEILAKCLASLRQTPVLTLYDTAC